MNEAKLCLAPGEPIANWTVSSQENYITIDPVAVDSTTIRINHIKVNETISQTFHDNVDRVNISAFTSEWGDDLPIEPQVLIGCCEDWPAYSNENIKWNIESLSNRFPNVMTSLDGGPNFARMSLADAKVSLSEYCHYCHFEADEDLAPLYIFDYKILHKTLTDEHKLDLEYSIPPSFSNDVMAGCNGSLYRPLPPDWMLIGAKRSGTPIHDHPLTVAWNALLSGVKLWVTFPPDIDESFLLLQNGQRQVQNIDENMSDTIEGDGNVVKEDIIIGEEHTLEEELEFDLSALEWFSACQPLPSEAKVIVQQAGEVVFVPAGWWHVVLNVEASVALSSSLALRRDVPQVLPLLRKTDEEFALFWVNSMKEFFSEEQIAQFLPDTQLSETVVGVNK